MLALGFHLTSALSDWPGGAPQTWRIITMTRAFLPGISA
jgi:hypothetical protein